MSEQEPVAWRKCAFCGIEHQIKSDGYILDTKTDEVFCRKCYVHTHEQEPVGVVEANEEWGIAGVLVAGVPIGTKLYAAPVRTKDLTDEEIEWLVVDTLETWNSKDTMKDFARAVIAKFKEKNK